MTNLSLGKRLRELRMKKGLTQVELSKGISTPSLISLIESDKARPSYRTLSALADKLGVPLEKILVNVDLNQEYMSNFKMAKALVADGKFCSAIPLLLQILEQKRTVISEDEILIELSECYMNTGEIKESEKYLARVQESAIMRRDTYMIIRTFRNMGRIEFYLKRYQLAAHHWKKALDEFERMDHQDIFLKAEILTDLGNASGQIGDLNQAIGYYTEASSLYDSASSMEEVAKVYMGLGQSYMRLMEYEKAAEYSQQAISIYQALNNVYMRIKVQMLSAITNIREGHEQETIQTLESCIQKLQELRKSEDVGIAYVELANVQFEIGALDKAEECCQIARTLLPELHSCQARGQRILGSVSKQRGNHEEACRRFKKAADCFKAIGEISEWATTMGELSRIKEERREFQEAIRILSDVQCHIQSVLHERGIVL